MKKITISIKKQVMCLFIAVLTASFSVLNAQVTPVGAWVEGLTHVKEAGSRRALVVILHAENGNSTDIITAGATYGGQAMTKVGEASITNGSFYSYTGAYVLNEAGIGAATSDAIAVTWTSPAGTAPGGLLIQSAFFVNVNQSTMVGASGVNAITNIGAIAIPELTNTAGDMIIISETASGSGFFAYDQSTFTKAYEFDNYTAIGGVGAAYMQATGTAVTPSVTITSQPRLAMQGFVLKKNTVTSINQLNAEMLMSVYLNPALNVLNINLPVSVNSKEVKIFNSLGKQLFTTSTNSSAISIDVNSLHYTGFVIVQVVSDKQVRSLKVLVK